MRLYPISLYLSLFASHLLALKVMNLPKGPFRTKNTTDSKFTTGSQFATVRRTLWKHCFWKDIKQQIATDSKKLRQ